MIARSNGPRRLRSRGRHREPRPRQRIRRRIMGLASLAGVAVLAGASILPAGAIPQSNPQFPTVDCGGVWHWVHNQTSATSGTLTAVAGTIVVDNGPPFESNVLHYDIELTEGDTLLSASDDLPDGNLLLSHWPTCPGDTAGTTTTVAVASTTSTAAPTETTAPTQTTAPTETTAPTGTPAPTTTAAETTTTGRPIEVLGTSATAPGLAGATETLPFTGISGGPQGGTAFALLALGGLVILSVGRRGEELRRAGRHAFAPTVRGSDRRRWMQ